MIYRVTFSAEADPVGFFSPELTQMVRVQRGVEIVPLDDVALSDGKLLVSSPSCTFLIPENELIEVGYN